MAWALQDAKNQLSKVIRLAEEEGPQTVTLRGERAAVVLSADDYDALASNKPNFVDYLLSGPEWDDELIEDINARSSRPVADGRAIRNTF